MLDIRHSWNAEYYEASNVRLRKYSSPSSPIRHYRDCRMAWAVVQARYSMSLAARRALTFQAQLLKPDAISVGPHGSNRSWANPDGANSSTRGHKGT